MKILVVDDEEDVRLVARLALSRVGRMTVIEASNGTDALAIAAAEAPDVILIDLMMPGLDGAATFVELLKDPVTASIPVIFLTASAATAEVSRLRALGATGVITKPFDPMSLAKDVQSILEGSAG